MIRTKHIFTIVGLLVWITNAPAQKMTIGFIFPAGGETGATTDIEIGGLNLIEATEVLVSGDGVKATIIPLNQKKNQGKGKKNVKGKLDDQSSPQLADRIGVRITIDKKATPGLRDLRLQSSKGVSNKLNFEVGQYPNLMEEIGSSASKPTPVIQLPITLCGQIMPGEIDYFSFKAGKGMKLVASVKARALVPYIADAVPGWFQPVIRLTNSKGREVAYNDDFRNAVDPVIIKTIDESDSYILSIHDAIYRGREDFNYRIELGEIPFLEFITPCVGKVRKNTTVTAKGVNLSKEKITFSPTHEGYGEIKASGKNGWISNPVLFWGLPKNSKTEFFPSDKDNQLTGTVFDSISSPNQVKTYRISAAKNEKIAVEIMARRLGSMLDAKMILYNPSGRKVIEVDDVEDPTQGLITHHADPVLQYKAEVSGEYILQVIDVLGNCGPDYYYLIDRVSNIPNFQTFVSPATLTIPRGGTAIFRVDITSDAKFIPKLNFDIKGLPKDFLVSSMNSQKGKFREISVTAPETAREERLSLEVYSSAGEKGNVQSSPVQTATAADNMMQAFYYTHHIPAAGFVAEVTQASAFSLRLSPDVERNLEKPIYLASTDSIVKIKIRINREEGFSDPIDLELNRKTPFITMDPTRVQPNETEKEVLLKINKKSIDKLRSVTMGIAIAGTVNGEIEKKGKRNFQNAKYRELTPMFVLGKN